MNIRKAWADSALSRLPPKRQADVFEHLSTHSLCQTQRWLLAEQSLRISTAVLACFYACHKQPAAPAAPKDPEPVSFPPGLSEEERFKRQLMLLSIRALTRQDMRAWESLQRVRENHEFIKLEEDKFKLKSGEFHLKWQADYERKKEEWKMAGKPINCIAILQELGKEYFGPDWEMPKKSE